MRGLGTYKKSERKDKNLQGDQNNINQNLLTDFTNSSRGLIQKKILAVVIIQTKSQRPKARKKTNIGVISRHKPPPKSFKHRQRGDFPIIWKTRFLQQHIESSANMLEKSWSQLRRATTAAL